MMTPGQEAVLTNIRENRWGVAECLQAALVANENGGPLFTPGQTDEQRAANVAFWIACAQRCEDGTADWLV